MQKGNPPTERKIQRLFRNKDVSTRIKRCNDFGAYGVCVAIGELADGLTVDLDKVPKKYEGLTAQSWPSPRARSAWLWCWIPRMWTPLLPQLIKRT